LVRIQGVYFFCIGPSFSLEKAAPDQYQPQLPFGVRALPEQVRLGLILLW